jgi:putative nucleotidyltransferase with HDIG domain
VSETHVKVPLQDLRIGHYISLDISWLKHPFMFSSFKISSQTEIDLIRELGLADITVIPERSMPLEPVEAPPQPAAPAVEVTEEGIAKDTYWLRKQEMMARDAAFRAERQQLVRNFQDTVRKVSSFARDLRAGPANAVNSAGEIIDGMMQAFEKASEVLVNLVHINDSNFTLYTHALNVTVLSVALARFIKLDADEIRAIGIGALLHDIGKSEIPAQILARQGRLTPTEEALLHTHPAKGAKLTQKVTELPPEAVAIIENHHEFLDGSGYPRGLKGNQLWLGVRVVVIANLYDNLINPPDVAAAISPRDAMAILYKHYQGKLDEQLVGSFIRAMGVYPPGTIVRLSNDNVGMVVSVDQAQLLRPRLIIYNPDIPRWNAMMIDLRERTDLEVREVLRPSECPPTLYEYLGISERLGFFYEAR